MSIISWIGSICFALCGVPQAVECYKKKSAEGLSMSFLLLWFFGEVCTLFYVTVKLKDIPLSVNYICNFICLLVILKYKFFPKAKP